jgi:GxxExxY protein
MKVHTGLGPGLLESVYEACLCHELAKSKIEFRRQVVIPVHYDDRMLECGFRADLIVQDSVIVEVKALDALRSVHDSQLLTYLRLSGIRCGLLINFNVRHLREGIRRKVF